ncbi:hypothetical protein O1L60_30985 [Streptomyces diastatochromogenes]|nr:hypothetical protein [Streptomyces diastatochromogenes]
MDASQIAHRFPLVARPRPACPPLAERLREINELAATAERDGDLVQAAVTQNKAALIASDCGLADLARTLCWAHAEAYLAPGRPSTARTPGAPWNPSSTSPVSASEPGTETAPTTCSPPCSRA